MRILQKNDERVETGVVKFGDDWPGVFFRGDDAARYSRCLSEFLDGSTCPINRIMVENLLKELESSNETISK